MIRSCLRWGYVFGSFSVLALIVGFFMYGQDLALPEDPGITLFYRLGFDLANPVVDFFAIDSLFTHLMLAGIFQVAASFCIGVAVGFAFHLVRQ